MSIQQNTTAKTQVSGSSIENVSAAQPNQIAVPSDANGAAEHGLSPDVSGKNSTNRDQPALYEYQRQAGLIRDCVRDVAMGIHNSTYIFGRSGNGKTSLVLQTLDDIGESYHYHAGHLTPLGFFDLLKKYCDGVIVIDDCASLFRDPIGQQLLLAALGTGKGDDRGRIVSYHRRNKAEHVNFTGGIIVITNLRLHESAIFIAIKSRTRPLSWDPSDAQLIALIRDSIKDGWASGNSKLTMQECHEALNFLVTESRRFNVEIDLRLYFDGALPDFAASKSGVHEADWRDHILMAIRERVGRLVHSGPPLTREARKKFDEKIAEQIRAAHNTRKEQIAAWVEATGKSERAFDRRSPK